MDHRILLVAFIVIVPAQWAAAAVQMPETGPWDITGAVLLENGNFHVNDTWTVSSGGDLTVRNATFLLAANVQVGHGGNLSFENVTIRQTTQNYYEDFAIYGNLTIKRCQVSELGIQLYENSRGDFDDSTFSGSYIPLRAYHSTIRIYNCTFVDNSASAMSINEGFTAISGSRFAGKASDLVDWNRPQQGFSVPGSATAVISKNKMMRCGNGIGVYQSQSQPSYPQGVQYYSSSRYGGLLLVGNSLFSGLENGLRLSINTDCYLLISTNDFSSSERGIYFGPSWQEQVHIDRNHIADCTVGIYFAGGPFTITENNISDCSQAGIYAQYGYYGGYGTCLMEGNNISSCRVGALLSDVQFTFRQNRVTDCAYRGISTESMYYNNRGFIVIEANYVGGCGLQRYTEGQSAIHCALGADFYGRVSCNRLENNPENGIRALSSVDVDNNTISGSRTGIVQQGHHVYERRPVLVCDNNISGACTGIDTGSQADIRSNIIECSGTGISAGNDRLKSYPVSIESNIIRAGGDGIIQADPGALDTYPHIEGNSIWSGGDGVHLEAADAYLARNTFAQTGGVCIHAIGKSPTVKDNNYPPECSAVFAQDWYLTIKATENQGSSSNLTWGQSRGATIRVLEMSGALVLSERTGADGTVRAALPSYVLDYLGDATARGPYNLTLLKPGKGVWRAATELSNNTLMQANLWPDNDLAVLDIQFPARRPVPGELVDINVTVTNDPTYSETPYTYSGVEVTLTDGGAPVGGKVVSSLFPGEPVTVQFGWIAIASKHVLGALIDRGNRFSEAFEDNNVIEREITVNSPPVACIETATPAANVLDEIKFSANGSTDDFGLNGYLYDFGDGTVTDWIGEEEIIHVYLRSGQFEARVMVRDHDGCTSEWSASVPVTVSGRMLKVQLGTASTQVSTLENSIFSAICEGMSGTMGDFGWDFGDGTTQFGRNASRVEHAYARYGSYTVTVRIRDESGANGTGALTVTVRNRPPEASFEASPAQPSVLTPVQFVSGSRDGDGAIVKWLWDFGDGVQSSDPSPVHTYNDDGTFTVVHAVLDDSGAWSPLAVSELVVRNLAPSARARAFASTVFVGDRLEFDALLTIDPDDPFEALALEWKSSDGWQSEGVRLSRRFNSPGKYTVTLTVRDDDGAVGHSEITVTVKSRAGPLPGMDYQPLAIGLFIAAAAVFVAAFSRRKKST